MPDEIVTGADTTTPAHVEPVVAEPTIVAELESIAVIEPIVELASLGTPEEVSATRIDAFPGAPLSENIDSPIVEAVAEPIIVAEQPVVAENPVAIETAPAINAITEPVVVEPVTAVEQPAPIVESPAVQQSGDLGSTPQTVQFEALNPEVSPEIPPVQHVVEPVQAIAEPTQMQTQPPVQPASQAEVPIHSQPAPEVTRSVIAKPQNIFYTLIAKGRAEIQARRRKKLDRIMGLFAKQASIVNDDVEKLLHISDATASRYLGILEKEGKIKRVGTAGRWVSYTKV